MSKSGQNKETGERNANNVSRMEANMEEVKTELTTGKNFRARNDQFRCSQCKGFFVGINILYAHMESVHGIRGDNRKSENAAFGRQKETFNLQKKREVSQTNSLDESMARLRRLGTSIDRMNSEKDLKLEKKDELEAKNLHPSSFLSAVNEDINKSHELKKEILEQKIESKDFGSEPTNYHGKVIKIETVGETEELLIKTIPESVTSFLVKPETEAVVEIPAIQKRKQRFGQNFVEKRLKGEIARGSEVEANSKQLLPNLHPPFQNEEKLEPEEKVSKNARQDNSNQVVKLDSGEDIKILQLERKTNSGESRIEIRTATSRGCRTRSQTSAMPDPDSPSLLSSDSEKFDLKVTRKHSLRSAKETASLIKSETNSVSGERLTVESVQNRISSIKVENIPTNDDDQSTLGQVSQRKRRSSENEIVEEMTMSKLKRRNSKTDNGRQWNPKSPKLRAVKIKEDRKEKKQTVPGLRYHPEQHHGQIQKVFKCEKCLIEFEESFEFQQHVQIFHSVVKVSLKKLATPNVVKLESESKSIEKSSSSQKSQGKHVSVCKECQEVFVTAEDLEQHIYKVECKVMTKNRTCTLCRITFVTKYILRQHMTTMHPRTEDVQTCDHCQKKYTNKYLMKYHLKKDHGVDFEKRKWTQKKPKGSSEIENIPESKKQSFELTDKKTKRKRSARTEKPYVPFKTNTVEPNLIFHEEDLVSEKDPSSLENKSATFQAHDSSLKDIKTEPLDGLNDCSEEDISESTTMLIPTNEDQEIDLEDSIENIDELIKEELANFNIETDFDEFFDNVDDNSTVDENGDNGRSTLNVIENSTINTYGDKNGDESGFTSCDEEANLNPRLGDGIDDSLNSSDFFSDLTLEEEEVINQSLSKLLLENPNLVTILKTEIDLSCKV